MNKLYLSLFSFVGAISAMEMDEHYPTEPSSSSALEKLDNDTLGEIVSQLHMVGGHSTALNLNRSLRARLSSKSFKASMLHLKDVKDIVRYVALIDTDAPSCQHAIQAITDFLKDRSFEEIEIPLIKAVKVAVSRNVDTVLSHLISCFKSKIPDVEGNEDEKKIHKERALFDSLKSISIGRYITAETNAETLNVLLEPLQYAVRSADVVFLCALQHLSFEFALFSTQLAHRQIQFFYAKIQECLNRQEITMFGALKMYTMMASNPLTHGYEIYTAYILPENLLQYRGSVATYNSDFLAGIPSKRISWSGFENALDFCKECLALNHQESVNHFLSITVYTNDHIWHLNNLSSADKEILSSVPIAFNDSVAKMIDEYERSQQSIFSSALNTANELLGSSGYCTIS